MSSQVLIPHEWPLVYYNVVAVSSDDEGSLFSIAWYSTRHYSATVIYASSVWGCRTIQHTYDIVPQLPLVRCTIASFVDG